jgi:hypothetical protein
MKLTNAQRDAVSHMIIGVALAFVIAGLGNVFG